MDPVKLTLALLTRAQGNGATVSFPVDASGIEHEAEGVVVLRTSDGDIRARHIILASGYERAALYLPTAFGLHTSYAVATDPGIAPLWHENAMIWQASESYIYARADADGRIIAGGGDEPFTDARHRDRLIADEAARIASALETIIEDKIIVHDRWAAMFGTSPDGLPAIGRAANSECVWLAAGFGGNGISFAALAAEILTAELIGNGHPDADAFSPFRFG
jgi:glycine/D-amino acid oxidase-like deaminating enzyme